MTCLKGKRDEILLKQVKRVSATSFCTQTGFKSKRDEIFNSNRFKVSVRRDFQPKNGLKCQCEEIFNPKWFKLSVQRGVHTRFVPVIDRGP